MQNYDEEYFRGKSNIRAGITWVILMILVSAFYYEKARKGEYSWSWYALLLVIGWAGYIIGGLVLRVKGKAIKSYKYIMGIAYLLFFGFISWTETKIEGYIFILPLIAIFVLYKDTKFIKHMMWLTLFVVITSNIYKAAIKHMMSVDFTQDMIVAFCMISCCYLCTLMSIKHLHESDGALTGSISSNLERVIRTVEQVKVASNSIVDGVTVVRELADENRVGAENVVTDMQELSNDNNVLNDKTMSSMEMTTVIDTQVKNVADLMEQVVELIGASVKHANTSSNELEEVVDTTNKMATLSA